MKRSDFNYALPPELIAQVPVAQRRAARMLIMRGHSLEDRAIVDLPSELQPNDLLVFNDTRVIPARLHGNKDSGGRVEILLERILTAQDMLVQIRSSKSPQCGRYLRVADQRLLVLERRDAMFVLRCEGLPVTDLLQQFGELPLPPYIDRQADDIDSERYQTVFAREPGAVAAPTAGLHFDEELLAAIDARGVRRHCLTLHVGAGTFQPVREAELERHQMHAEQLAVSAELCAAIAETRADGGRIVAVGTTVVRALETAAQAGEMQAFAGESRLFITPGYRFRVVDALLTNFHLPESTLLMLVSAFAGHDVTLAAYKHAIRMRYRFFSYGDAMWIPQRSDGAVMNG